MMPKKSGRHVEDSIRHAANWVMRHVTLSLVILLCFSFILKLIVHLLEPGLGRDACLYLHMAKIWAETGCYHGLHQQLSGTDWIPPLLPFLIRSLMLLGVPAETAGLAINISLGSLTAPVGFGIALETTGNKKIALMTALLLSVHPGINDLSTEIQRDAPYLFFSGCAAWLILAGLRRKKPVLWCGAGIALAFSLLMRYETMEFLPLIAAAALIFALPRRIPWKWILLCSTILIVCAGITFHAMLRLMGADEAVSSYSRRVDFTATRVEQQLFGKSESRGK